MMPPRRERPVPLRLPRIESEADARRASAAVIEALGEGRSPQKRRSTSCVRSPAPP
jgi:hypothetical protein